MTILRRTEAVLSLVTWKEPRYVGLTDQGVVSLEMDPDKWIDMGCASSITVTVEVGDLLSEGSPWLLGEARVRRHAELDRIREVESKTTTA